jgi:hypothetical protein
MDDIQLESLHLLQLVLGQWRGNGTITFPTIPTRPYREELNFAADDVHKFLRYEQRTWKQVETGEYVPSHWETGFWRLLPTGEVEILNAQGGGRVEVLLGSLTPGHDGFVLNVNSTLVANDARMAETSRQFILVGNSLQYSQRMSTTAVPVLALHVQATLARVVP